MNDSSWAQPVAPVRRLARSRSGLLVVDIQQNLLPAMIEPERVLRQAILLARGARVLGVPCCLTEQYPKGLGPTVPELAEALPSVIPSEKLSFSAWKAEGLREGMRDRSIDQWLVCGIEAHVCVAQTCLDLLQQGMEVFVAADATASRTQGNWQLGLDRLRHAGATIVSVEMALFEWLEQAGTPEFKQILALVK